MTASSFHIRPSFASGFFALLATALFCLPLSSAAQSTETQQVQLESGWNVTSFYVQPSDSSLGALFDGSPVLMVKNEAGEVYLPTEGIEQISFWRTGKGYWVYANETHTLEVTGAQLSSEAVPIVLEEGGNLVPYLSTTTQAVEPALRSIEESLIAVEDEHGNEYAPGTASSPLDSLRSGQGYKVYVDRADTLRYPYVTRTLDEALALQGLEVGDLVRVRGARGQGDTFKVTDSGAETDGGTVFAFDEDTTPVTETVTAPPTGSTINLSHSDLKWGSVDIRYGTASEDVISGLHLHGQFKSRSSYSRFLSHQNGSFQYSGYSFLEDLETQLGWDRGDEFEASYEHATSNRRLERQNVGNSVQLEWWGPPTLDPNNVQVAGAHLVWAMDKARRVYQNNSYEEVNVEIEDDYYVRDQIKILDGVVFEGVGPLNSDGFSRAELRVPPGEALYQWISAYHNADGKYDITKDPNRERVHSGFRGRKQAFWISGNADATSPIGFRNLKYNGNLPNNGDVFDTNDYSHFNLSIERYLQDSGDWQGFYGKAEVDGKPIVMDGYHVRQVGGSGVGYSATTDKLPDFDVDQLKIHRTERNHLMYNVISGPNNWVENVDLSGAFWGGSPIAQTGNEARFRNVTLSNILEGRYSYNAGLSLRRGGGTLRNITIDLRGSTMDSGQSFNALNYDGTGIDLDGLDVWTFNSGDVPSDFKRFAIFNKRSAGSPDAKSVFKNVTIRNEGVGPLVHSEGQGYRFNNRFENVEIIGGGGIEFQGKVHSNFVSTPKAIRHEYVNLTIDDQGYIAGLGGRGDEYFPQDWMVENTEFNNTNQYGIVARNNVSGKDWWNLGWFWRDVTLNDRASTGGNSDGWVEWFEPGYQKIYIRLRNSQTHQGRVSDETGTYTSGASDEGNDFVLIPTSLLTYAFETGATVTSPSDIAVSSVEVANGDGTLRSVSDSDQQDPYLKVNLDRTINAGETISVDWTARVTPLGDFTTTGVFTARPPFDESFTSGSGPWTVDLRGVAASMESEEKIVYTASSGDTSVVTASVQGDDYTLELTEAGTGTATITVTGEIPGVGTTSTTFEVTVN